MRSHPPRPVRNRLRFGVPLLTAAGVTLVGGTVALAWPAAAQDPATPNEQQDASSDGAREESAAPIAIRAKRVIVRAGEELENAVVLIEDGRIDAVGTDVEVPDGARVIEGEVVSPGFIDPWSIAGIDAGTAGSDDSATSAMAADAIDPFGQENVLEQLVRAGVLMTRSQAAKDAEISGIAAVLRTADGEVVVPDAALAVAVGVQRRFSGFGPQNFGRPQAVRFPNGQINFGNQSLDPIERVGQIDKLIGELASGKKYGEDFAEYEIELAEWKEEIAEKEKELEEDFKKAKKARDKKVEKAEEEGEEVKEKKYKEKSRPKPPRFDPEKATFARVVNGELPLVVKASRALEIREILRQTEDYGRLRLVIAGGEAALSSADLLVERGVPVIVVPSPEDPENDLDAGIALAGELDAAGVDVLIGTGATTPRASRDLALLAALAVGGGLDPNAALDAITSGPARVFDLGAGAGTIRRGASAELLVLSGDPLSSTTRVLTAVSGGDVVYEAGE